MFSHRASVVDPEESFMFPKSFLKTHSNLQVCRRQTAAVSTRVDILRAVSGRTVLAGLSVFELEERNMFSSNTQFVKSMKNNRLSFFTYDKLSSSCSNNPLKRQCGDWFKLCHFLVWQHWICTFCSIFLKLDILYQKALPRYHAGQDNRLTVSLYFWSFNRKGSQSVYSTLVEKKADILGTLTALE